MSFETLLAIAVIGFAVAVAGWLALQRRRRDGVHAQFDRAHERRAGGDRDSAELAPEVRPGPDRDNLPAMRPLSRAANHHFSEEWASVQALFADDPDMAVEQADGLVGDVLRARGYSVADVELGGVGVALPHPRVVERYREAHAIATAMRETDGGPDTEAGRHAFGHYQALFADLLKSPGHLPTAAPLTRPRRAS